MGNGIFPPAGIRKCRQRCRPWTVLLGISNHCQIRRVRRLCRVNSLHHVKGRFSILHYMCVYVTATFLPLLHLTTIHTHQSIKNFSTDPVDTVYNTTSPRIFPVVGKLMCSQRI